MKVTGKKFSIIVSVGCVIIILMAGIIWYWVGEVKPLKEINIAELDKMTVAYHAEWLETAEREDMKTAVEALQMMHLRRAIPMDRAGFRKVINKIANNPKIMRHESLSKT